MRFAPHALARGLRPPCSSSSSSRSSRLILSPADARSLLRTSLAPRAPLCALPSRQVRAARALGPPHRPFTDEDAEHLLRKKLDGVIKATATCYNASWRKQLLHVWAGSAATALVLERAYAALPPALTADTVVLVTVCQGVPEIFDEKATPPGQRVRLVKGLKDDDHLAVLRQSDPLAKCGGV